MGTPLKLTATGPVKVLKQFKMSDIVVMRSNKKPAAAVDWKSSATKKVVDEIKIPRNIIKFNNAKPG